MLHCESFEYIPKWYILLLFTTFFIEYLFLSYLLYFSLFKNIYSFGCSGSRVVSLGLSLWLTPEFPVVTRESRRNSRKTTWLPPVIAR